MKPDGTRLHVVGRCQPPTPARQRRGRNFSGWQPETLLLRNGFTVIPILLFSICSVLASCGNLELKMEAKDQELLAQFADRRCEHSFRQLVERHLGMVFSVAMRVTGERGLAEEIAQTTFVKLAEKSSTDAQQLIGAGWLYHTSRNLALAAVRSEQRRRQREHVAVTMNTDEPDPGIVAEHLESAMDQLKPEDRDALVLRFFEDRNLRDVGRELGLSEDAARMRVNRSLEKLRNIFGKLGITGTTAWLTTALPTGASAAVPSGLSATITTTILSGGAIAAAASTIATETASNTMNAFLNLKTVAAVVAAAAITGTSTYMVKDKQVEDLRVEYQTLNQAHAQLAEQQSNALETIQLRNQRIAGLEKDITDLPRLRGDVDRLNRDLVALQTVREHNVALELQIESLKDRLAKVGDDKNVGSVALGVRAEKREWVYAGYGSPEATLETGLWGGRIGDQRYFLNGFVDDIRQPMLSQITESGEALVTGVEHESIRAASAIEVISKQLIGENEVEVEYVIYGWNGDKPFRQPFKKVGSEWKISGEPREAGEQLVLFNWNRATDRSVG
jgi:RNA polymerase sigma factor (sigma-70 family)